MDFFHREEDVLNQPGFWGDRTSAVDWCETNYTTSYYIAEFFNTITSLPAALLALNTLYLTYKYGYDKRFIVINLMVAMVGLGSAAFHGTLLWTGQITDELPMVYASLSFLYAVLEMEGTDQKPVYKYSAHALILFACVFTSVYLYLPDFFIFFLVAYIGCILTLAYHLSIIYRRPNTLTTQKFLIVASIGCYIGGWAFFWVPEILFCGQLQSFNFHSWWHVTSTIGGFLLVIFSVYQRELVRGRRPQLSYNSFAGIPLLPYIHIPSRKEIEKMEKAEFKLEMDRELAKVVEDEREHRRLVAVKKSSIATLYR